MGFTLSPKNGNGWWCLANGWKVVEGGQKMVKGGLKVVEGGGRWLADGWKWLKVVGRWFWVHKIVFTGGLPPPRPPALPGGLPAPQTPWRGPPCSIFGRLRLSSSPFFLVPRSWYQDLRGNRSLHDGGTALSAAPNRYPFFTVRTPQASLVGDKNTYRQPGAHTELICATCELKYPSPRLLDSLPFALP